MKIQQFLKLDSINFLSVYFYIHVHIIKSTCKCHTIGILAYTCTLAGTPTLILKLFYSDR